MLRLTSDTPENLQGPSHQEEQPARRDESTAGVRVRDANKSLLPFARVQKIIKADKARRKFSGTPYDQN
jgi:hypothetical protein